MGYSSHVPTIVSTLEFDAWLGTLSIQPKAKVMARMRNMSLGNNGDCEPVGEGVSESRIHYGPGYRLYFVVKGDVLTVLLCGGDKSTQSQDIIRAKELAQTVCQ